MICPDHTTSDVVGETPHVYAPWPPFGALFDQVQVPCLKPQEACSTEHCEEHFLDGEDIRCLGMRRVDDWFRDFFRDDAADMEALKKYARIPSGRSPRKARREPEPIPPPANTLRTELPFPPRGLSREDAAAYVGVSARKFDELVADGRMPKPVRIDGRRIWDRRALDQKFDALGGIAEDVDQWEDGA
jgi:predicted DNA-binding transcriptional regulator AlpA